MIGSDDVLACFIAGNAFTWDDWFRLETEDDSLQPTIDMLLNVSIFLWFGAVCPWHSFVSNDVIPIYRLIPLGILVLLFRRLPMILAFHKYIHQIEEWRHAVFVGFFGPIGVSAIFYLYISREFLAEILFNGAEREDATREGELIEVVVWFLVICSIVVHGLSIPVGKFGLYLPRTISEALSQERSSRPPSRSRQSDAERDDEPHTHLRQHVRSLGQSLRGRRSTTREGSTGKQSPAWSGFLSRLAKSMRHDLKRPHGTTVHGTEDGVRPRHAVADAEKAENSPASTSTDHDRRPSISAPTNPRIIGRPIQPLQDSAPDDTPVMSRASSDEGPGIKAQTNQRSIRFPDDHDASAV